MKQNRNTPVVGVRPGSDELRACEQLRARLGPEESALLSRISLLKSDKENLQKVNIYGHPLAYGEDVGRAHKDLSRRIALIDQELSRLETRLGEIGPKVYDAQKRASALIASLRAETQSRVEALVQDAMVTVAPSRARFLTEKAKRDSLQEKLTAAKAEVQKIRSVSKARQNSESKALSLLETGTIPPDSDIPTDSAELKRALGDVDVDVMETAIRLQAVIYGKAKADFAADLVSALTAARADMIQRIASGYGEAAEASFEGEVLNSAICRETDGHLTSHFGFYAVKPVTPDRIDSFSLWLDETRRAGYDV